MSMKVKVDKNKCTGCEACVAMCPEVFVMKGGKATVKNSVTDAKSAKDAADYCAGKAISVS